MDKKFNALTINVEPELAPPTKLWETVPSGEITGRLFPREKVFSSSIDKDLVLLDHPVIQGFINAYRGHRPVTISPDIIWLLILQGFSHHVNKKSEKLRSMFVNFIGQKELTVKRFDVSPETCSKEVWAGMFPEFVEQISSFTGSKLAETLTPSFSTTTPTSLAVGQISIMSSLQKYFKHKVEMYGCGFPTVTIEGTVEDWEKINNKISEIEKYDLSWWTKELTPIIDKIIRTKKGDVDTSFWKQMIRIKGEGNFYNPTYIDGWFKTFFPYNAYGKAMYHTLHFYADDVTNELLKVPFVLYDQMSGKNYDCVFLGGFVGLSQDQNSFNIKPEIGWIIKIKKDDEFEDEFKDEFDEYMIH